MESILTPMIGPLGVGAFVKEQLYDHYVTLAHSDPKSRIPINRVRRVHIDFGLESE